MNNQDFEKLVDAVSSLDISVGDAVSSADSTKDLTHDMLAHLLRFRLLLLVTTGLNIAILVAAVLLLGGIL